MYRINILLKYLLYFGIFIIIYDYMHKKKHNQTSLAKKVNVSGTSMSTYFTRKTNPDIKVATQMCVELEIPVEERGKVFLQ